jgi:hypothetical protein
MQLEAPRFVLPPRGAERATVTHSAPDLDVLLIGCGLRGTGLLTAVPELLQRRLGIVEASPRLGPGSFSHYRIQSNSSGKDFFGWVRSDGPFGPLLRSPKVRRLREYAGAFELHELAAALECFGEHIEHLVGPERIVLGDSVVSLQVEGRRMTADLRSGRQLRTRCAVLATGIREVPHLGLQRWNAKHVLSGDVIRHGSAVLPPRGGLLRVAIVGASHSTYAVARLLREANLTGRQFDVTIVHRSPVKLFYGGRDEYEADARSELEAVPDPIRDACPETGNLFRYSGLRHGARAMFRAIADDEVPMMRHWRVESLAQAMPLLDSADVVVQAMGYESNSFELRVDGHPCAMQQRRRIVDVGDDGRLRLPLRSPPDIFVMGMDPYPYDDNSLTPTGQYAKRGHQLLDALAADSCVSGQAISSV